MTPDETPDMPAFEDVAFLTIRYNRTTDQLDVDWAGMSHLEAIGLFKLAEDRVKYPEDYLTEEGTDDLDG